MNNGILRILDANTNRLREALRVCEDITRFILSDKKVTEEFKRLRHKVYQVVGKIGINKKILAGIRNPQKDSGRKTIKSEIKRKDVPEIFRANIKRAQESVRVLEEFSKLFYPGRSEQFKKMRYKLYSLEKKIVKRLQA